MKKNIFYSTRKLIGIYQIIVSSCKINYERQSKLNTKYIFQSNKIESSFINFTFFFIKCLISTNFLSLKKLLYLKYKGIDLGRHTIAMTFRNPKSYTNLIIQKYLITFNLFRSYDLILKTEKISKNVKSAFIDHAENINGLVLQIFLKRKIKIYQNAFPIGFFLFKSKSSKILSYEKLFQYKREKKKLNSKIKKKSLNALRKFSSNPSMPYILGTRFKALKIKDKNYSYLVYCHSFTDAQLHFGVDGFYNQKDWLEFTLNELSFSEKNILVKSHPNFYAKGYLNNSAYYDRKIYDKIRNKFRKFENISFLNSPIKNINVLKSLNNNKTIVIGHHTTALLEALALDFKCISSSATFWDKKMRLTNLFSSREEFSKLLKKDITFLKSHHSDDLIDISYKLLLNPKGYFGNKYIADFLAKKLSINRLKLTKDPDLAFMKARLSKAKINQISKKLSYFIQNIDFT